MFLTELTYKLVLVFIRVCKWIEFQILTLFSSIPIRIMKAESAKFGVVYHLPNDPPWTEEDERKALQQTSEPRLVHIKVKAEKYFFTRLVNQGGMCIGEDYINGHYDATPEDVTEFMARVFNYKLFERYFYHWWNRFLYYLEFSVFNLQTRKRAWEVGEKHYDLGNDLYEACLGRHMQYTCAYFANADNLDDGQLHKMELIAKKLELKPGMRVLDIGCGWGSLMKFLAERYGVSCVGITVSKEGVEYARKLCEEQDVEVRLQDYREVNEKFDRIVSVGMFEHVGFKNYKEFMKVVHRCLTDDGIFLLQTMGRSHLTFPAIDPFTHTYVFPNGYLPNNRQLMESVEGLFVMEDWHNFGLDYAKTAAAWRENFRENWPRLEKKYGEKFYRFWTVFLSMGSALFATRRMQLWQIVFSKDGLRREYRAAR